MSWAHPEYLVETDWLAANLEDPAQRVLECTTILHPLPDGGYKAESGRATWAAGHIPRSGFADLTDDRCYRAAAPLHMPPFPGPLAASVRRIAGSGNVPARALVDPATHAYLAPDVLRRRFAEAGALEAGRVITYCGGGIAASSDAFVLTALGHDQVSVYDASLSEWARDPSLPMETGWAPRYPRC